LRIKYRASIVISLYCTSTIIILLEALVNI